VTAENTKQFEAFLSEVELLMRLRGKENVIQVLDAEVDRERGRIHLVMEIGDMDLGEYLRAERMSLARVQSLWKQILEAVQVIHNARIVHSDLKPQNFVMVGGQLKVIDFGIAKRISNDTTNIYRDASVGTVSYMAPETVKQGQLKLGRSSDIWSLGIILYQMVYGNPPFAHMDPMQRVLTLSSPDLMITFPAGHCLESHAECTKSHLMDVLERCLQRDPRKRPSTDELLAHPFLSSVAQVGRQQVEVAVASLMDRVSRLFGEALENTELANSLPSGSWQVLADEVWEQISRSDSNSGDRDIADPRSLIPLSAIASRLSDLRKERDAATREKEKLLEHTMRRGASSSATEQVKTSKEYQRAREERALAREKENVAHANTNPTIQRLQAAKQRDLQSQDHSCHASRGLA
jgi:serine/threonine protein kinase